MEIEETEGLKEEIKSLLAELRRCDTQPTAVAWMKRAFVAMEGALAAMNTRPMQTKTFFEALSLTSPPTLVLVNRETPRLELGPARALKATHGSSNPAIWVRGSTTVYDNNFTKAFTRADTRRLEKARKA